MTQEITSVIVPGDSYMGGSIVHSLLHFVWLLRRRKGVVIGSLAICGLLGMLYYATAARIYRAEAQVVVRLSQPENSTVTLGADRSTQDQMATFQRLFTSAVVLNGGLDKMSQLSCMSHLFTGKLEEVEEIRLELIFFSIALDSTTTYSEQFSCPAYIVICCFERFDDCVFF